AALDLRYIAHHVVLEADLVRVALKGDPGLLQAGGGKEADALALRTRLALQAMPLAERPLERQVRAEAHADGAAEGVRRRLHEERIDERRARGVAHQHRRLVGREA